MAFVRLVVVVLLVACFLVVPAFALINVGANGLQLGYGNGTTVNLGMGTYQTIERLNNIWYVNGEVYPTDPNSQTNNMLLIGLLGITGAFTFAVIMVKRRNQ